MAQPFSRAETVSLAYIHILRPINCVMMGVAVSTGSAISAGPSILAGSSGTIAVGFLTGFLLTGASMVLNDYADREIDTINEPSRPIPSGAISSSSALIYGASLTTAGILTAFATGITSILAAAAAWLIFLTYTLVGKRSGFFGNILVSICVAAPFIYGAIILNRSIEPRILTFASIAFLANLGREVNKGILDIEGDREKRVRTVAVRFGPRTAAILSATLYLSAVWLSLLPLIWAMVTPLYYVPFVLLTDLGLGFSAVSIIRKPSRDNARAQKRAVLIWMLLGLAAFLAGSIP